MKLFKDINQLETPFVNGKSTHVFHQYTLKTKGVDRALFQAHLSAKGVPAMIYYPVPLHQQKAYVRPEFKDEYYPVTMELCESVISLPMHTELDENQLKYILQNQLKNFLYEYSSNRNWVCWVGNGDLFCGNRK